MNQERTPSELREGVRSGILDSIQRDVEHRSGRTVRLLVAAGMAGVLGAIGVTLLVSTHPFGHHPPWHFELFSAVWAGLLVVSFAICFLGLRTPRLPIARATAVGLVALGLAGLCSLACPDQHFLHWWGRTGVGGATIQAAGPSIGALCFGAATTLGVALVATLLLWSRREGGPRESLLPALMVGLLLAPGVALQSHGTSVGVFLSWLSGTFAGAYAGVAAGRRLRARWMGLVAH